MSEPIEKVIRQQRFALELLISKYELDLENMVRCLKNIAANLKNIAGNKGEEHEGDGNKRPESR